MDRRKALKAMAAFPILGALPFLRPKDAEAAKTLKIIDESKASIGPWPDPYPFNMNITTTFELEQVFDSSLVGMESIANTPVEIGVAFDVLYKGQLVEIEMKTFGEENKVWPKQRLGVDKGFLALNTDQPKNHRVYYEVRNVTVKRNGKHLMELLEESSHLDIYEVTMTIWNGAYCTDCTIKNLRAVSISNRPLMPEEWEKYSEQLDMPEVQEVL